MSELLKDMQEATESLRDHYADKKTLRTHKVPAAKPVKMPASRIRKIRSRIHMSQEVFARYLHTSRRTLEKWEQGTSRPTGAAAALLALVDKHPELMEELANV